MQRKMNPYSLQHGMEVFNRLTLASVQGVGLSIIDVSGLLNLDHSLFSRGPQGSKDHFQVASSFFAGNRRRLVGPDRVGEGLILGKHALVDLPGRIVDQVDRDEARLALA